MEFYSLGQYFYKLYTIIFILLLLPLGAFIFLYYAFSKDLVQTIEPGFNVDFVLYGAWALALMEWSFSSLIFNFRLRSIRKLVSLGEKLALYGTLTIVRFVLIITGMLVLSVGYYFSQDKWLTISFIVSLIIPTLIWPSPNKVVIDLKLKGDERMMVLYKMDLF